MHILFNLHSRLSHNGNHWDLESIANHRFFLSKQHDRKRHVYVCPYNRAKAVLCVVSLQSSSLCQSIHDTMCNLIFKGLNACQESTRPIVVWWSWATVALSCNPEVFMWHFKTHFKIAVLVQMKSNLWTHLVVKREALSLFVKAQHEDGCVFTYQSLSPGKL